jgi:hypothetical protein
METGSYQEQLALENYAQQYSYSYVLPSQLSLWDWHIATGEMIPECYKQRLDELVKLIANRKAYAIQTLDAQYYNILFEVDVLFQELEVWYAMPFEFLPQALKDKPSARHRWDKSAHVVPSFDCFYTATKVSKTIDFTESSNAPDYFSKAPFELFCRAHIQKNPWYDEGFWRAIANNCAVFVPLEIAEYLPEYCEQVPLAVIDNESYLKELQIRLLYHKKSQETFTTLNYQLLKGELTL